MNQTSDLDTWTVKQLQAELKRRKLQTSGLKAALIERLKDDLGNDPVLKQIHSRTNSSSTIEESKHSNGSLRNQMSHEELKEIRHAEREERHKIVIWRKPLLTIHYFILESFELLRQEKRNVLKHRKTCTSILAITLLISIIYSLEGAHQPYIGAVKKDILWCLYWIGLGVLSSVGLGTGLHTFILYLGPHIAKVTLAAWECNALNFPEPPYPNDIVCPSEESTVEVNMFTIMSKVRLEAVMWGAGTAIGELPPYFMARAARLSGDEDPDNEDLEELEELISSDDTDLFTRAKKAVPKIVEKVGFFGILLFASIPNPLFDLAGITCGHCLVPFWTFFGATLIGKAIIKMHIQQTFVILCFSKSYVESVLNLLGNIPYVGSYIQSPFQKAVQAQKDKLHQVAGEETVQGTNILGFIFEKLVTAMIIYFVISIINSMAQSYAKKIDELKRTKIEEVRKNLDHRD